MKNGNIGITVVLLALAVGNYFTIISADGTRPVEFLSIFAIGMLSGVLITQVFKIVSERKQR